MSIDVEFSMNGQQGKRNHRLLRDLSRGANSNSLADGDSIRRLYPLTDLSTHVSRAACSFSHTHTVVELVGEATSYLYIRIDTPLGTFCRLRLACLVYLY